jgi:hypothetical protein
MRLSLRSIRQLSHATLIVVAAAGVGYAQQPAPIDTTPLVGWFTGASIGVPGSAAEPFPQLFTAAISLVQFRARGPGADLWLGTIPYAFSQGLAAFIVRANLAAPIATRSGGTLLASAGLVAGGGGSRETDIVLAGVNAGISSLIATPNYGIRVGLTAHIIAGAPRAIWLAEIGFVDFPVGRGRPPRTTR